MKWLIAVLALAGVVDASLALREHYRTDTSPCSINEKWDCGTVNHSPYAVFAGTPVAIIGIAGYTLLSGLAFRRAWRLLLASSLIGLVFSLYLTSIEADKNRLGVWCIYCVTSQGIIALIFLASVAQAVMMFSRGRKRSPESPLPRS
ncbi:MAG: vitamin K epoxide reductase family protein [Terriglobales bacterium]